jgi:hypothetical protein
MGLHGDESHLYRTYNQTLLCHGLVLYMRNSWLGLVDAIADFRNGELAVRGAINKTHDLKIEDIKTAVDQYR